MKALAIGALAALAGSAMGSSVYDKNDLASAAAAKGIHWLVSVQGNDGGWGQDGGETAYARQGERLESGGNDVANTAVATLALLKSGHTPARGEYRANVQRAVQFILKRIEESAPEGLAITNVTGSQIQRKLGPYIDTFLSAQLLAELDGAMGDTAANQRVRRALQKCVAKIEANQQKDGSWNISGGWAPILGTTMASRSLDMAKNKGVKVEERVLARVDQYTRQTAQPAARMADGASAGVSLYKGAQVLEQLSRTEKDRVRNAAEIGAVTRELNDERFVNGFGSMGGEEFFSYLNISDSLHRAGGEPWRQWNGKIKTQLVKLQNENGTWAGHHCITGRVAVTSAAILTLLVDRS